MKRYIFLYIIGLPMINTQPLINPFPRQLTPQYIS